MTRHLTDLSKLGKAMENSDHLKQIGEISGIELLLENKSIVLEVDSKSKVCCFLPSRVMSFCIIVVDLKSIWGLAPLWHQAGSDWCVNTPRQGTIPKGKGYNRQGKEVGFATELVSSVT